MVESANTSPRLADLRRRWEENRESRLFLQLAEEYRRLGQNAEAAQVLEEGLAHRPNDVAGKVALGRCQLDLNDVGSAVTTLEQVIAQDPAHIVASKLLVDAQLRAGDVVKARERLSFYRLLNDRDPELDHFVYRLEQLERESPVASSSVDDTIVAAAMAADRVDEASDATAEVEPTVSDSTAPQPAVPQPVVPQRREAEPAAAAPFDLATPGAAQVDEPPASDSSSTASTLRRSASPFDLSAPVPDTGSGIFEIPRPAASARVTDAPAIASKVEPFGLLPAPEAPSASVWSTGPFAPFAESVAHTVTATAPDASASDDASGPVASEAAVSEAVVSEAVISEEGASQAGAATLGVAGAAAAAGIVGATAGLAAAAAATFEDSALEAPAFDDPALEDPAASDPGAHDSADVTEAVFVDDTTPASAPTASVDPLAELEAYAEGVTAEPASSGSEPFDDDDVEATAELPIHDADSVAEETDDSAISPHDGDAATPTNDAPATLAMAEIYAEQGHRDEAVEMLERIIAADPDNADAVTRLAALREDAGDGVDANEALDQTNPLGIAVVPDDSSAPFVDTGDEVSTEEIEVEGRVAEARAASESLGSEPVDAEPVDAGPVAADHGGADEQAGPATDETITVADGAFDDVSAVADPDAAADLMVEADTAADTAGLESSGTNDPDETSPAVDLIDVAAAGVATAAAALTAAHLMDDAPPAGVTARKIQVLERYLAAIRRGREDRPMEVGDVS